MKAIKYLVLLLVILALVLGIFFLLKPSAKGENHGDLRIDVLDIGQGDAILIQTKEQNILIDTGDVYQKDTSKGGTDKSIVQLLKKRNIKTIDKIIISHPHADHLGGIVPVMRNFKVKAIYDNGEVAPSKVYRDFLKEQKNSNNKAEIYKHINNQNTKELDFGGGVVFKILSPTPEMIALGNKSKDKQFNNNSIVGKLIYGKFTMLFTGDAERETEKYLVKTYGTDLNSEILKVGHHGSASSSTDEFLTDVDPKYGIISCGANSRYHHPHLQTLNKLDKYHIKIFATNGNNKFPNGDNGNTIEIFANKNGEYTINKIKE